MRMLSVTVDKNRFITRFVLQMIDPVLSIAAAMSVQSPFTSKAYTDHDAMV